MANGQRCDNQSAVREASTPDNENALLRKGSKNRHGGKFIPPGDRRRPANVALPGNDRSQTREPAITIRGLVTPTTHLLAQRQKQHDREGMAAVASLKRLLLPLRRRMRP